MLCMRIYILDVSIIHVVDWQKHSAYLFLGKNSRMGDVKEIPTIL